MEAVSFNSRKMFWGSMVLCFLLASLLSACDSGSVATKSTPGCVTSSTKALAATVPLPAQPFQALATRDGKWIFVSMVSKSAASNGVAVLSVQGKQVCVKRVIPFTGTPLSMVLDQKEDMLLVANYSGIAVIDAKQAEQQVQGALLGYVRTQAPSSTVQVALSPDEHYVFVTNENEGTLGVFDFQRIHSDDFNPDVVLSQLPLGAGLLGLAMSQDNRYLYATIGVRGETAASQGTCATPGSLLLMDLQRLKQDPTHLVVAKVPAGCDPAHVYLSTDDSTAWVTARGDDKVLAFNTLTLLDDPKNALVGSITVGVAPSGLGIAQNGLLLFVASSNRFAQPQKPQTVAVLNVHKVIQGQHAVVATLHVGAFPREVTVENDDQTVLLTDFGSNTLTIINAAKLPKG